MRIAITGASGLVGGALAERLQARGDEVVRVRRGPPAEDGSMWDPVVGWVKPGAFDGCEAVVHLSGASIGEGRWTARRRAELRASRIDSTRVLVDHLATLEPKPRRLLVASAVGYYGDRGDELLTEASSAGEGFLAELVRDWEAVAARAQDAGISTVMTRGGVAFDKQAAAFRRIVLPFKLFVGGRLGSGKQWVPWVTLEDTVAAMEHLLGSSLEGPVNVAAPGAVTNAELAKAIGKALGRPALFPVPRIALRLAVGAAADELLFASQRVVPERLLADGFAFRHADIDTALEAITA